jgi:1-acyl-sn-glycerol-3-phosphate acyltransferase
MNLHLVYRAIHAVYTRRFVLERCPCTVIHRERLPSKGPAILVANHASLSDAVVIQMLYPASALANVRPTGARDYFEKSALGYWAVRSLMRMCFINRGSGVTAKRGADVFKEFREPLKAGNILIYFPQGTRTPGAPFLPGVFHLSRTFPDVPVIPILLSGTREMFPPGAWWPQAHPVRVHVGEEFVFDSMMTPREYAKRLEEYLFGLAHEQE